MSDWKGGDRRRSVPAPVRGLIFEMRAVKPPAYGPTGGGTCWLSAVSSTDRVRTNARAARAEGRLGLATDDTERASAQGHAGQMQLCATIDPWPERCRRTFLQVC